MSVSKWFNSNVYMANKLEMLQKAEPAANWDMPKLTKAFEDSGFAGAEGAEAHFTQYGNKEGISPTVLFEYEDYLAAKVAADNNITVDKVTPQQIEAMRVAFAAHNLTAWDHYQLYWAEDYADGKGFYNPAASADVQKYMDDKLAQMQTTDKAYTMDMLVAAFKASGLDPIGHYSMYGKGEGLVFGNPEPDPDQPVTTHKLTVADYASGFDNIIGGAGKDHITGTLGTLDDGDVIDGGAGDDLMTVSVSTGTGVISPVIKNVEEILFRAQLGNNNTGDGENNTKAFFDAENVKTDARGKLTIGSDNSRADMTIEDIRVDSNNTTIRFADADSGDVDLDVFFDNQYLKSDAATTTGTLNVQLIDTVGALPPAQGGHSDPLYSNPYTGFNFTLNGKEYTLNFGAYNHVTDATPSYAELIKQIQDAVAKDTVLSKLGLVITEGGDFPATVGIGGSQGTIVYGKEIIITTEQGSLVGGNWQASNGLPNPNSTSADLTDRASTECPLIQTNVELDNVGRVAWNAPVECLPNDIINGSDAGDLTIGAMGQRGGIERMDITVDRGSWLSSIQSTNDSLRMITVEGEDIDGNGKADDGSLFVGNWVGNGTNNGNNVGNNGTIDQSMFVWTDAARLLTNGLKDVAVFDAAGYKGDINIGANITADSYNKYLKDVDGVKGPDGMAPIAGYDNTFTYNTGAGKDVINMSVDGAIAADNDFKLNISTGAGEDLVAFRYSNMSKNQSDNQMHLKNVNINTGDGDDTVWFYGSETGTGRAQGSVIIEAGAGDDVIYANQVDYSRADPNGSVDSGGSLVALQNTEYNAVFVFNTNDTSIAGVGNFRGATFANDMAIGDNTFAITTPATGDVLTVTVTFMGHSVTGKIGRALTTDSKSVSAQDVNDAIIKAIADDPVLGNLLSAKDGAGNGLIIESLINGKMSLGDLNIAFGSVNGDKVGTSGLATGNKYNTNYGTEKDSPADGFSGNSTTDTAVIADGGDGNDLIVLGPNTKSDIVKLSAGNDNIIGFMSDGDMINLGNFLNDSKALDKAASAASLKDNSVAMVTADAKAKNGIFTQEEVSKMVTDKALKFDVTASATGLVLLHDVDANGNHVYTIVKMVNGAGGTTATGTVVGSFTMDSRDGIHTEIGMGNLTLGYELRDANTGITYSEYTADMAGFTIHRGSDGVATGSSLTGTTYNDVFNNLNSVDLASLVQTSNLPLSINGSFGEDAFNVTGDLAANISLNGGGGVDTFNIDASKKAIAVSGDSFGGMGNDVFNVTSKGANLATFTGKLYGGEGDDTFNFKSVATSANKSVANQTIALIDGGNAAPLGSVIKDSDSVNFTFEPVASGGTPGTDKAAYTVSSFVDIENITVGKDVELTITDIKNTADVATVVTIKVDDSDTAAKNLAKLTMTANSNTDTDVSYHITGGLHDDTIFGGAGDDTLTGGKGADKIHGGKGDDKIILTDTTADASGSDTVYLLNGEDNGKDTITGFKTGVVASGGDVLNVNGSGLAAVTFSGSIGVSSAQAVADDTVYVLKSDALTISSKDFGGADFAELFGSDKAFLTTGATVSGDSIIVVQGKDVSHLYVVNNTNDTTITADEVTLIGILDGVTAATTDAFVSGNFAV